MQKVSYRDTINYISPMPGVSPERLPLNRPATVPVPAGWPSAIVPRAPGRAGRVPGGPAAGRGRLGADLHVLARLEARRQAFSPGGAAGPAPGLGAGPDRRLRGRPGRRGAAAAAREARGQAARRLPRDGRRALGESPSRPTCPTYPGTKGAHRARVARLKRGVSPCGRSMSLAAPPKDTLFLRAFVEDSDKFTMVFVFSANCLGLF